PSTGSDFWDFFNHVSNVVMCGEPFSEEILIQDFSKKNGRISPLNKFFGDKEDDFCYQEGTIVSRCPSFNNGTYINIYSKDQDENCQKKESFHLKNLGSKIGIRIDAIDSGKSIVLCHRQDGSTTKQYPAIMVLKTGATAYDDSYK